jgi:mannose-6-phosphate isomerase-like protein (cupin superfamily)
MQPSIKKYNPSSEYYFAEGCFITEVSNSDDDPDLSIARARVEPGVTTRLHQLIGTIERYVILEGVGSVELGGCSHQKVAVGDVVIIPPGCAQRITNDGSSSLIFLAICSPRFKGKAYHQLEE